VRAEEQQRQIVREQREQVEREHAEERLLQRRAEAAAKVAPSDQANAPRPLESAPIVVESSAQKIQRRLDFSFPLMARSAAAGLLAGLCAFLLGRLVQHKLPSGHHG
jgi:hypothetical protein